jgi:hypothetical protein
MKLIYLVPVAETAFVITAKVRIHFFRSGPLLWVPARRGPSQG